MSALPNCNCFFLVYSHTNLSKELSSEPINWSIAKVWAKFWFHLGSSLGSVRGAQTVFKTAPRQAGHNEHVRGGLITGFSLPTTKRNPPYRDMFRYMPRPYRKTKNIHRCYIYKFEKTKHANINQDTSTTQLHIIYKTSSYETYDECSILYCKKLRTYRLCKFV